jgi:type III secretory pathway component EscV
MIKPIKTLVANNDCADSSLSIDVRNPAHLYSLQEAVCIVTSVSVDNPHINVEEINNRIALNDKHISELNAMLFILNILKGACVLFFLIIGTSLVLLLCDEVFDTKIAVENW